MHESLSGDCERGGEDEGVGLNDDIESTGFCECFEAYTSKIRKEPECCLIEKRKKVVNESNNCRHSVSLLLAAATY